MTKLALIAFFLASPLFADQVAVTKFKLLNTNENSAIIDPSQAQDLLNVDVTPGGGSVKKRSGYGIYKTLTSSKTIHGGYHFFDSTGNDVQVWGSSSSLWGIVADGTPTQLVSSATLNSTWDCVDTQGSAYCVTSNRDTLLQTNGATKTWFTTVLGTMVEATPDRLVVAGVSGSANTLFVSQSNTFTNFTTGVLATDAFTEPIAGPGSKLTHIRWGCGKLLWWKDQSFGYFDFDDQYAAQTKIISDTIGTFDNTSAIDPGGQVWFRGQDGHTYKYDCSVVSKESIDITPSVLLEQKRTANSWTQTTAADFNAGTAFTTFTDTTTTSGSVMLSGVGDDFTSLSGWTASTIPWTISGSTATGGNASGYLYGSTISINNSFFLSARVKVPADNFGVPGICMGARQFPGGYWICFAGGAVPGNYRVIISTNNFLAEGGTPLVSQSIIGNDGLFHVITATRTQAGVITVAYDGVFIASTTSTLFSNFTQAAVYQQPEFFKTGCSIDTFYLRSATGTFTSVVKNAPSLTAWSTFGANTSTDDGSHSYFIRAANSSFAVDATAPAWVPQTNGALISTTTGVFFQVKDSFTVTAATQNPTLNDFTVNWFEGSAGDQAYMTYFDNAIWEAVPYGVGQSSNNYIFKFDLINDGWTLYSFGAGGMIVQANTLYFGSTTSNDIFNFGTVTSDSGTAITAYWKSKDFTGSDPFQQNQLTQIDTFAKKNAGATLTATYTMETSTATSYSINLSTTNAIVQSRKLLPSGKNGYVFNMQYGDVSAGSAWEILGFRIGFIQQPYRPTP